MAKKTILQPLYDRIFVVKKAAPEVSAGGLIIPDSAREKLHQGTVVAAGPGKMLENGTVIKLTVKVGDQVMFSRYAGTDIKVDGEDVLSIREDELLAIVTEVEVPDAVPA